jgi:polar amino acid transport system substrate-binding protein
MRPITPQAVGRAFDPLGLARFRRDRSGSRRLDTVVRKLRPSVPRHSDPSQQDDLATAEGLSIRWRRRKSAIEALHVPLMTPRKANFDRLPRAKAARGPGLITAVALILTSLGHPGQAHAQAAREAPAPAGAEAGPAPAEETKRPVAIRFVTEGDYPPFNYYDDEGVLTGFNVDLARAICLEVGASCDVKVQPWDDLLPSLRRGEADAVIASHMVSGPLTQEVDFSDRYFHTPGRFAGRVETSNAEITPDALDSVKIGVAKGTTHEAYLKAFFRDSRIVGFENADLVREALQQGKVDYIFDDGISLSFWLGGTLSRRCCEFKGGAYFESKYFGDGLAIALSRQDPALKAAVNAAIKQVRLSGRFEELVERYFPNRIY